VNYGRYKIVKKIGEGAMGEVYQAHDPQIDRLVALKVLREDRLGGKDFVLRFLKEAKAIGRLSHPNIVTVYDVGRDHGTIYIAMEYLEGKPFNEVMSNCQMRLEQIVDIGIQVARTLNYAHAKGIVHRDIKPSNIILADDGQVKLTDFGIARIEDADATLQTQVGDILGTPTYMSPEQVMGKRVDGRSDLYSLGVFLYELTVGKRPFLGDNIVTTFNAITQGTLLVPIKVNPSIPRTLSNLIVKVLSKNPDERFQTGAEMTDALKTCLESKVSIKPPKEKTKERKISGVLFLISSLIVFGILGVMFYFIRLHPDQPKPISPPNEVFIQTEFAVLYVTSSPTGAQVYLDNSFNGQTPLNLKVPFGKYEVKLSLPDYYEWEAQLNLKEGGETPLFVRLMPIEK
jgi:serine/threonine protein kinase